MVPGCSRPTDPHMGLKSIIDHSGSSRKSNSESKLFLILATPLAKEGNPEAGKCVQHLSLCVCKFQAEAVLIIDHTGQ